MRVSQKFAVVASDYGRAGGWIAEIDSQPVARLSDVEFEDMFWESYKVSKVGHTDQNMQTDEFWNREVVFRSRSFPEIVVSGCIARWSQDKQRLVVRSLYIHGVEMNIVEKTAFMIWRLLRARKRGHH